MNKKKRTHPLIKLGKASLNDNKRTSPLIKQGKASTWHTERRQTEKVERDGDNLPVLADSTERGYAGGGWWGGGGGGKGW